MIQLAAINQTKPSQMRNMISLEIFLIEMVQVAAINQTKLFLMRNMMSLRDLSTCRAFHAIVVGDMNS